MLFLINAGNTEKQVLISDEILIRQVAACFQL